MEDIQSLIKHSEKDSILSRKLYSELTKILSKNQHSNDGTISRRKHLQDLLDLLALRQRIISQISLSPVIYCPTVSSLHRLTPEVQNQQLNFEFERQRLSALNNEVKRRSAELSYTDDNNRLRWNSVSFSDVTNGLLGHSSKSARKNRKPDSSIVSNMQKNKKNTDEQRERFQASEKSSRSSMSIVPSRMSIKDFKSEILEPHGFPCPVCNKIFRKKGHRTRHLLTHEPEKPFGCDFCSKRFAAKYSLQKHLLNSHNTDRKPFNCEFCEKNFTLRKELETHLIYHEEGSKQKCFPCSACDLKFITIDDLESHIKTHPQPILYRCDPCDKGFSLKIELERHVLSHKNGYSCSQCGKSFTIKYSLIRHQLSHSSRKPFHCNCCGKDFVSKTNLRTHLQSHERDDMNKPLVCHICCKRFSVKQSLKFHIAFHTQSEAKPYACNFCEVRFTTQKRLQQHFETHGNGSTEGRQTLACHFPCQYCKKTFSSKFNLSRHMTIHNPRKSNDQPKAGLQSSKCQNKTLGFAADNTKKTEINSIVEDYLESVISHKTTPPEQQDQPSLNYEDFCNFKAELLPCYVCNDGFESENELNMHMQTHASGGIINCVGLGF